MYYLRAAGVSPGTVGLGTSSGPASSSEGRREGGGGRGGGSSGRSRAGHGSPFASGLLSLLLDYAGGVLDVATGSDEEGQEEEEEIREGGEEGGRGAGGGEEMAALRRAVRYEAAEIVGQGLDIFLPEASQKVGLLIALLRLWAGGESEEDCQGEAIVVESRGRDGRSGSIATGSEGGSATSSAAAAAAATDGPLPPDMDEEGCAALLAGVCNAVCSDPNLLLSLVPETVRPPLTVRDVSSYVATKVRSAEKAHGLALKQRLVAEATANPTSTAAVVAAVAATSALDGAGERGSAPPRLGVPRVRGAVGDDSGDGTELWKSGPTVDIPRAGDVVVRGPDWVWGGQDGDAGARGLVVAPATWGRGVARGAEGDETWASGHDTGVLGSGGAGIPRRNAVRVMWEKGAVNVYRWGVCDSADPAQRPCYDLKVLRAPSLTRDGPAKDDDGNGGVGGGRGGGGGSGGSGSCSAGSESAGGKGGRSKGHGQAGGKGRCGRGELKWSVEEVEVALTPEEGEGNPAELDGDGYEAPTTREVLRFIKNNAPQEWREPRRITGAENALVKVTPSTRAVMFVAVPPLRRSRGRMVEGTSPTGSTVAHCLL